jgi:hypothetical protein
VHPPGKPEKDRLPELAQPTVPISDAPGLRQAVTSWLDSLLPRS